MFDLLFDPFSMGFMRRALAGCIALSLAGPPLGVFLVLRRMSLTTDVLQHGILPGIALGAVFGGMSLLAMGAGGLVAGLAVTLLAGWLARVTAGREDSQLAAVTLIALAAGVAMVRVRQSSSCRRSVSPIAARRRDGACGGIGPWRVASRSPVQAESGAGGPKRRAVA